MWQNTWEKQECFILAHDYRGVSPWSAGSFTLSLWWGRNTMEKKQRFFLAAREQSARGQRPDTPCQVPPVTSLPQLGPASQSLHLGTHWRVSPLLRSAPYSPIPSQAALPPVKMTIKITPHIMHCVMTKLVVNTSFTSSIYPLCIISHLSGL